MSQIAKLIAQFEALRKNTSLEVGPKNQPAPKEKILELERLLGEKLPDDLRAFYEITNGWYSIDGRYMDIEPVEEVITGLNDSENKRMCLLGTSGQNDFYIFLYTKVATGNHLCFILEDWFEEVQISEDNSKDLSPSFREKLLSANEGLFEEGKFLSPPLTFTQVLEHLYKYNASQL
jgi:SMI1 / KNR4 family (SUKH-1)